MDVKMWNDDEVTTRNCFHCKTAADDKIYCRKGKDMGHLRLSQVSARKMLYAPCCNNCTHIDCNWY